MAFVPIYIVILGGTIVIDYVAGILLERNEGRKRKLLLVISLISNIGVLAAFKYYNFLNDNLTLLLHLVHYSNPLPYLNILLPIGLSFHTFQAMSYTIEVYRGNQKAERNFGIYALYVMFYPQLVAGPIERPQNMLHQFYEEHKFNYNNVSTGLKLMAWGLFKKVVIADRLAIMVNTVYSQPQQYQGIPLIIATVFFSFQIYCDFSGYSDIAIGSARVMGFDLMQNFNRPYFSKSVSEFWRRWHISLSTWFRDYLYIPLGGNRVIKWRWYYNLFITFLISGLWHGANWTFIVWGALHGVYLVFAIITQPFKESIKNSVGLNRHKAIDNLAGMCITFLLITIAWVFFRANTISDAWYVVTHFHIGILGQLKAIVSNNNFQRSQYLYLGQDKWVFIIGILSVLVMEAVHLKQRNTSMQVYIERLPVLVRWSGYYALILAIVFLGVFTGSKFIYFQF